MFMVPVAVAPQESVAVTVNTFKPISPAAGVPESAPLLETDSQARPFTLEKVSGLPSGSVASPAIDELYEMPTVALVLTTGLLVNAGGRFVSHGLAAPPVFRTTKPINACRFTFE